MADYIVDICETLKDDFLEYAGHVMQERSLPDARDCLKDGARKILYSQYRNKNNHTHNFVKGQAAVGRVLIDGFLHGDASAYSTLVRMGKFYAVPYTLEEIQGNGGNQTNPDSHAAGRYLEIRQSELASYLFDSIEKNSIDEWYWNYSNTLELPRVLPTMGFYPIVNGVSGISVGLSTSIPSTNLREVNEAIIKLIRNPDTPFDDIYCAPDFPMGGTVINGSEVKESFRTGTGKSVRMRARIDYIPDKNILVATQIPFSVYTDTIDAELLNIINGEDNPGIEKYIDATNDDGARINIYLSKDANPETIIKTLYKRTSLESYYGINMIMLDNGRFPKVFSWKEALMAYITHIRICKKREVEFDLDKALARKNIVEGLLLAAANIDEVITIIRSSKDPEEASEKLIARFSFNDAQVKSILAMKLSSLTKIDSIKLDKEFEELKEKIIRLEYILNEKSALDEELVKKLQEVADKFGRERQTKVIDLVEKVEMTEKQDVVVNLFSDNTIQVVSKEDSVKSRKKPTNVFNITNFDSLTIITSAGKLYNYVISDLEYKKVYALSDVLSLSKNEKILLVTDTIHFNSYNYLVTVTKNGYVKKTPIREYNSRAKKGIAILKLEDGDSLLDCYLSMAEDKVLVVSNKNRYSIAEVNSTGRLTKGTRVIKLEDSEIISQTLLIQAREEYENLIVKTSTSTISIPYSSLKTSKGHKLIKTEEKILDVTLEAK